MIGIVDYGMGNIASVRNTLSKLCVQTIVSDQAEMLEQASHIILPGVGSFHASIDEIEQRGLKGVIQDLARKKPILGVCLGMQLLFSEGFEGGRKEGLDLIPGQIKRIKTDYILPHIGWNQLHIQNEGNGFRDFEGEHVYFVHSYQVQTDATYIVATTDYGTEIPAIVQKDNVFGMQFHPEKSGKVGLELIKMFLGVNMKHDKSYTSH
ncbi:imidazole glycerol phosphate synthase subunit HisH [Heyndrickxia shackletonii]|uniref:Imidazole glycerol phosphate synthase subunit HisH n=1 Tax=Heyndrickxia shackletonii TaxID=157838 RepID=A0A0Q3WXP6_9BACI|nr:imidazole glycerol phosphate synthase subunit HisH [Heyndrickxia shackletonii]KQL53879.1 imidazole glycerol phosphate synthase subunit HisH [Heyndrickxia shackletonii]NEY97847.1 imidazole glycerol phosphate synthase subunit HisH [Heyndrickxia shackletonii]